MAEQNNQTERAAPELLPCPFCGSTDIDPAEWSGNDGKSGPGCGDCGALGESVEAWNLRAALPAAVDAEGLPEGTKAARFAPHTIVYTAEQVQMAIAADRRKQAALTQMIELGQEIEASGERQSIGHDVLFGLLLGAVEQASSDVDKGADPIAYDKALREFIAYIDGRTDGAAWVDVKEKLPEPGQRVLVSRYAGRVANTEHPGYPDKPWLEMSLIPQGFATFLCDLTSTGYVTHWARIAAPSHQSPGKEGA